MSFNNFQKQPQQPFYQNQNVAPMQQNQFQQQNVQPLFPQPQGNVYNINSTLEVANVPVGAGISVALCLTVGDFVNLNLPGRWLITMRGHITCVIDGMLYDTFDCSDNYIWCIYRVK